MDSLQAILAISKQIRCKYPNTLNGENINYSILNDFSKIKTYLQDPTSLADCAGVTWLVLLQYYLVDNDSHEKTSSLNLQHESLADFLKKIPNPDFHIHFPR